MTKHVHDLMVLVLDGEASPRERAQVVEHLSQCQSCSAEWQSIKATDGMLDAWSETHAHSSTVSKTMSAVYLLAQEQGRELSWTEQIRRTWFFLFRPMRLAMMTLLFVCLSTVVVMKIVPRQAAFQSVRLDLVPCDIGSSYDDHKIVAVAVAQGDDPITVLAQVSDGEAQIISIREEN